ncbi:MAG: hypothetical protein KKI09_09550 [Spirochaetes bacterium]|nr:hypothetical protein [Spirochaetota bacterium]MBU0955659.1 hypothetical protein [Spirochaetota bacterium]
MKKLLWALITALFLFICQPLLAQETALSGIMIMPVEAADDPTFEVLAKTMQDTIRLNLNLMRQFRTVQYSFPEGQLRYGIDKYQYARSVMKPASCDNAVFVDIVRNEDTGYIAISVNVYAYTLDQISMGAEEELESLFDIFDAADRLTVKLLEGLVGRPIEYGSLRLDIEGNAASYRVYVDQEFLGENVSRVPAIMTDRYQLRITQQRLLGELELLRQPFDINADQETVVKLVLPSVLAEEIQWLSEQDAALRHALDRDDAEQATQLLEQMRAALDKLARQPGFEIYQDWLYRCERWHELLAFMARLARARSVTGKALNAVSIYNQLYLPPELGAYALTAAALAAAEKLSDERSIVPFTGYVYAASSIPYRPISIDGRFEDWVGSKEFTDRGGEESRYQEAPDTLTGMRVLGFSLARDDRWLFLRVRVDGLLPIENVELNLGPSFRLGISNGSHHLNLSLNYWKQWDCQIYETKSDWSAYRRLGNGIWNYSGDSFEMAVPLALVEEYVQAGRRYAVHFSTGSHDLSAGTDNPPWRDYHYFTSSIRY